MGGEPNKGMFSRKRYATGEVVPSSAIYECSECKNITAYKSNENFTSCPDCHTEHPEWYKTNDVLYFVSKNLNKEFNRVEGASVKIAEVIADFAGNIWFVYFHVLWFGLWIWMNTGHAVFGVSNFDPYPFPFLVLVVSLEAIFLATFILISQNVLNKRSEMRGDLDYETNIKTEKDVSEILSIVSDIQEGQLTLNKDGTITLGKKKT